MTFTSPIFFIGMLPWLVVFMTLLRKKKSLRPILIFLANSIFYIWGGVGAFIFMCIYAIFIWIFSIFLYRHKNKKALIILIICTLIPLLMIKYTNFVISNVNSLFNIGLTSLSIWSPIGISFFTFEAVSFLVDLYKGKIDNTPRLWDTYLYLSFFPTVTSGPIVRYDEFKRELINNNYVVDYNCAIERITIGLCKKVLIADKISILANYYFDGVAIGNSYSCVGLWIGSIAYTFQLYFDFSGYSDMAIGIGQLLGFNLRENFNKPYQANSISDFWKRWHISLTQWFRDYVYIPLGGNRCSISRHLLNMLIVWIITGIWHGADWSFILWGLGYFILLVAEKYVPVMKKIASNWWGHIYALFFINLLWIPFRASNLECAAIYVKGMFDFRKGIVCLENKPIRYIPLFVIALLLCFPWNELFCKYSNKWWFKLIRTIIILILLALAICAIVNSSYTPYIYGNF